MTGSGTRYTAQIPAQPNGTEVSYYVLTSGNGLTISHSDADLYTIDGNTNGGSNYSYTVEQLPAYVTVSPFYPTDTVPVTIQLDASGTDLAGAGQVYLHSGISTVELQPKLFQNTVGNWGQDDGVGAMTSAGPDQWTITLSNLRDYYQVSETQDIFGLNFLFRNEAGSLRSDNNGLNYHVSADPGNYFNITSPDQSPYFIEVGEDFDISAQANVTADRWILIELDPADNSDLDTLDDVTSGGLTYSYTQQLNSEMTRRFKIVAGFGNNYKFKWIDVTGFTPPVIQARPSGLKNGVNYHSDDSGKATLVLHCPTFTRFYNGMGIQTGTNPTLPKQVVYVVGDFNNWTPSPAYKMKRDTGQVTDPGDYFWIELTGLEPEQEYVFQYLIDGVVQVADPYTHKVSDFDDVFIPDSVYPDLIPYPSEAQDRASVLQTNKPSFTWTADTFSKPTLNNLNIYELHFRDFTEEGTYLAAIEHLDYIKGMGFNAIHVMPVSEFEGNSSWGYNPNFYFAADKAYGTENDLKKFIDECHKREIQVFNDIVLNHAFYSSVMARMYWNNSLNRPADDSPYFNPTHRMVRNQAGWWGADWNHESEHVQEMVDSVLGYWLSEFRFDGFRFDFTKGFGQTDPNSFPPGDDWASSYNQERIDLLKRMVDRMWNVYPGTVVIFEHLANSDEDKVLADHGILMWSGVGHHAAVKNFVLGYANDNPDIYTSGAYNAPARNFAFANWMSYAESHDEERMAVELNNYFNWMDYTGSTGTSADTLAAVILRLRLGLAFNLLLPGPRMMWQFQELGYDYSINYCTDGSVDGSCRTGPKPVRWDYFDDSQRIKLFRLVKYLFKLRNERFLYHSVDYGNTGVGANNRHIPRHMRLTTSTNEQVIVIGNLDPGTSRVATPGYNNTGTWYRYNGEVADPSTFTVNSTSDTYTLLPNEVLVLTNFNPYSCTDVRTTADSGIHSLRNAVDCAQDGDVIHIDYNIFGDTITLLSPIHIDKDITIQGFPSRHIYIDGNQLNTSVFSVASDKNVTIKGITILCADDPGVSGRCIHNSGILTLDDLNMVDSIHQNGNTLYNNSGGQMTLKRNIDIKNQ
jgi:1,4-alpha-glucan branching enzyme